MLKYIGFFLWALCFPADFLAQKSSVDSIQKKTEQSQARQFESLFFDGIKEKAVENYDKAIKIFKKCRAINPEEGIIYVELAKSYAALENYNRAEQLFKDALQYLPKERKKTILRNLYELYKVQQKPVEALEIAQQFSNDPYFQLEVVKIYQLMNQFNQALEKLNELEQKDPFYTEFYKYRYEIYKESNQLDLAITHYKNKINQGADNAWNYCKLIEFLMQNQKPDQALKAANRLDAKGTSNSIAWECLSDFYIKADQKEKATAYVKKILTDKYTSEKIKFSILEQYRKYVAQHPELESKLISMLNNALKMEKSQASNLESAKYYEDKDQKKALQYYRLASEDQPNNFKIIKKLCLLELKTMNYGKAKKVAQHGLSLYPGQAVFYYVKGKASLNVGNYKDSVTSLKEALMYVYDDPTLSKEIKQALVKAYRAKGNEKRADELLQEIKNTSK